MSSIAGFLKGNFLPGQSRSCDTTGLPVCNTASLYIRLNAVIAVVSLLIGAIAAILIALTRWPAVHLLPAEWFYRFLTVHGFNMLIFWIIFLEIGILYFVATTLLNSRLFSKAIAAISFALMLIGMIMVNAMIFTGQADVLFTSYVPLMAHPLFYLGIILFAVGALLGVANFFLTIHIARRDKTYEGPFPLVVFGAITAAVIAVVTILHGAVVLIPTLLWSAGLLETIDPGFYRVVWWGLGHMSQQINVAAMISVWYFMFSLIVGAKPLNHAVCRGAFILYILFINLASAHHLLVDPGVSTEWKIWNTSYAMYLAVLASMLHGFTVPGALEVAMRKKGYRQGLFGWLAAAPWSNPGFSGVFMAMVMFGFIGGITGVTIGTEQISIITHNTLKLPAHFHGTVVAGTTLTFMALAYYVVPLIFQKDWYAKGLLRLQPYIFAIGIFTVIIGMQFAGSAGIPRRHWDISFAGTPIPITPMESGWLALVGIGGVIAFLGLLIFLLATVATVFFGRSNKGRPMEDWGGVKDISAGAGTWTKEDDHKTPGTWALVMILLTCFVVYFFANWKALADVWWVH
ncbi:MAG: cbb3-type cytochrome c oxidase subunit I [Spirochaetia bacterium]|nr:cbb3-type cytochrome c oxidase subunit I [Spirochaetia bacterium]